jgi:Icc-related predicted phosphoesterase
MKILAIGDFHGKFPMKLRKRIKKENPDLIISIGDYFPFFNRKLFFKYSYATDIRLWEILGKKKVKTGILKDLKKGKIVLNILNKMPIKVFSVIGNMDYTRMHDCYDVGKTLWKKAKIWKWEMQNFFSPIIKKYKNIKMFEYKAVKFGDVVFIGGYGHTFPGHVKSKNYKKYKKKLDKLFKKFRKENKNKKVIFVFHNMPYNCKLDVIRDKEADERAKGKHYGSKLIRRIINKYRPVLGIGGHMHENQGKCKIGKTTVINTGDAERGKAAIIDFDEKKGRIKNIKFIKK